jgi:hypothetical protein
MKSILLSFLICLFISSCTDNSGTGNNGSTGKLKGTVFDKNGKIISDVQISTLPVTSTTSTDASGEFQIYNVPTGTYVVTANKSGYSTGSATADIAAGYPTNVTIILEIQSQTNNPPVKPYSPHPGNNSTINQTSFSMTWDCSDPDGDQITYDLFFGSNPMKLEKVAQNLTQKVFSLTNQKDGNYYWRINARDTKGASTDGDLWSFTIKADNGNTTPGLVEYLKLDGNAKAEIGYDGTAYGVTWTTDRFGTANKAAYFASTSSLIEVIQPNAFNLKYDMTLAMWIKPVLSECVDFQTHIDIFDFVEKIGYNEFRWYGFGVTRNLGLEYWTSGLTYIGAENDILKDGVWNHVALVYARSVRDGNTGSATLYINGKKVGTTQSLAPGHCNPDRIWIGLRPNNLARFGGAVDDIYLYNRALTEIELKELIK